MRGNYFILAMIAFLAVCAISEANLLAEMLCVCLLASLLREVASDSLEQTQAKLIQKQQEYIDYLKAHP